MCKSLDGENKDACGLFAAARHHFLTGFAM
jgi:hypothetical protein